MYSCQFYFHFHKVKKDKRFKLFLKISHHNKDQLKRSALKKTVKMSKTKNNIYTPIYSFRIKFKSNYTHIYKIFINVKILL